MSVGFVSAARKYESPLVSSITNKMLLGVIIGAHVKTSPAGD